MATGTESLVRWRSSGDYLPINASKAGLLAETRQFLQTFRLLGTLAATRRALIDGALPQRSRETRFTIVKIIQHRLTRWSPPAWVLDDLVQFASTDTEPALATALLLHTVRQDALLYEFVQQVVTPRWEQGDHMLIRTDVQRFLDIRASEHPEILYWSTATREKLAGNVLSILRDYGLLQGRAVKQITEPVIPQAVVIHLIRLLQAEGVADEALASHPDWRIWLFDVTRAQKAVSQQISREVPA